MRAFAFIFFAVGALDAWALLDARAVLRRSNRRLSTANFAQLKITASDAEAYGSFGNSVAIDGNTVAICAGGGGVDGTFGVYVLRTSDGGATYVEVAKLTVPDAATYGDFASSVAIDGDTIVIGAAGAGTGGAVYVFRTTDGGATYDEVAKLTAADAAADDSFGGSVAIDGDTVVIGATGASTGGAVYVFSTSDGGVTYDQVAKLTAADGAADDEFGDSVAIDGDTVVVGANQYSKSGSTGVAYVFRTTDGWASNTEIKLTASDAAVSDLFGTSVAIAGDTVVIGAWGDQDAGLMSGSAYVFRTDGGGATYDQVAKLTADDGAAYNSFGISVAIDGDTIVVGAYTPLFATSPGRAYIFQTDNGGATYDQVAKLTADDGATGDQFGMSVAIDGETIVIGASRDNDGGTYSGSAYVFSPPAPTAQPTLTPQPTHSPKPTMPQPTPKPTTPQPTPQPTTPQPTPQPTPEPSTGALGSDSATRAGGTLLALVVTVLAL